MDEFRSGSLQILITTDPHVQGVNIREPYLVINYDIPNFENYILRITSVCSSGRKSIVVNFVLKRDLSLIQDIKGILFSTRMSIILQNGGGGNAFEFRVRISLDNVHVCS